MQTAKPYYFVRTDETFDTMNEAEKYIKDNLIGASHQIGYYVPQPQYKNWVPSWLIKLITIK